MEDYVTYEQAIKLKELGFDWECTHFYNSTYEFPKILEITHYTYIQVDNYNDPDNSYLYSAPTLAQVQKWLREKYYLSVEVYSSLDIDSNWEWDSFVKNLNDILEEDIEDSTISYQTYEQALSEGIDRALELLKEQSNRN